MIRHVSFDLWLTLIKSHPQFKQRRAEIIADLYNPQKRSPQDILSCITTIDRACNRFNETRGCKIPSTTMYQEVLLKIGNKQESVTSGVLLELMLQIDRLVKEYPPCLLNQEIPGILEQLKGEGKSLNLSSNTGFIESKCLVELLRQIKLLHYFDFCVFSDEVNTSKPSASFFKEIIDKLKNVARHEVLHIGDNATADFDGAKKFGFQALLINNQHYTINDIRKFS